jgi:hypothetical protein
MYPAEHNETEQVLKVFSFDHFRTKLYVFETLHKLMKEAADRKKELETEQKKAEIKKKSALIREDVADYKQQFAGVMQSDAMRKFHATCQDANRINRKPNATAEELLAVQRDFDRDVAPVVRNAYVAAYAYRKFDGEAETIASRIEEDLRMGYALNAKDIASQIEAGIFNPEREAINMEQAVWEPVQSRWNSKEEIDALTRAMQEDGFDETTINARVAVKLGMSMHPQWELLQTLKEEIDHPPQLTPEEEPEPEETLTAQSEHEYE